MARSERAKALEAKQKAEMKAEKERRRTSADPKDWGRIRQLREGYKATVKYDPKLPWILLAAVAAPVLLAVVLCVILATTVGFAWYNIAMTILTGLMAGLLVGTIVFTRRGEAAALKRYEGQAGSAEVALQMLGKQWQHTSAIAFNKQRDVVHRALGPGGLVLVGEGDPGRVRKLLTVEAKRHEKALYETPAQVVLMGNGEGQVPLRKLTRHIKKLPKSLTKVQISEAAQRLKSLDAVRQRVPLPKGPMPNMRGARKAMRGR